MRVFTKLLRRLTGRGRTRPPPLYTVPCGCRISGELLTALAASVGHVEVTCE